VPLICGRGPPPAYHRHQASISSNDKSLIDLDSSTPAGGQSLSTGAGTRSGFAFSVQAQLAASLAHEQAAWGK
jgi:hypothetical protein